MLWLTVVIFSYLILAMVTLGDKWFLAGRSINPKVYVFYIGGLQIFALLLIPFVGFVAPSLFQFSLGLAAGMLFVYGMYWFFRGLQLFEPSRIVPAVGGLVPIFSFLLILVFSRGKGAFNFNEFLAFCLLIAGSVLLTHEKAKKFSWQAARISLIAAALVAFSFVLTKYVYLEQPFWSGFILTKLGSFFAGMSFLIFSKKEIFTEIFHKKAPSGKITTALFFLNQSAGAGANVLQNWAIALVPLAQVAFVNALQGVQYVFLLALTLIVSLKFPKIIKEQFSREIVLQKAIAILIIGAGLALLAINQSA